MRDGISLSADVYLPLSGGPHPTICQWTPYESTRERFVGWGVWFAQRGYAAVVTDVRGRYESEGEFEAWSKDGVDAQDTLTWAAGEEWCNGRIGTWGRSYGALVQWQLLHQGHPNLAVRRAAGDPRRLLLGRLLDGRRLPARAHARRRRDLDERDQPDHRPERARPDPERPALATPAADRARRGRARPQGRLLARVVGAPGERRVLAAVPPSARQRDRADLPAGRLVRPLLRLAPALVRGDRRPRPEPRPDGAVVARGGGRDLPRRRRPLRRRDRDPRPRARLLRPLPPRRGQRLGGAPAARALRPRPERVARRERVAAARHRVHAVLPAQRRTARPRRAARRRAGRPVHVRPGGSRADDRRRQLGADDDAGRGAADPPRARGISESSRRATTCSRTRARSSTATWR